jgi:hypothetical protein
MTAKPSSAKPLWVISKKPWATSLKKMRMPLAIECVAVIALPSLAGALGNTLRTMCLPNAPRLGWYAINILRRRLDMCSDLNMPGSAADTGLSLVKLGNGEF